MFFNHCVQRPFKRSIRSYASSYTSRSSYAGVPYMCSSSGKASLLLELPLCSHRVTLADDESLVWGIRLSTFYLGATPLPPVY